MHLWIPILSLCICSTTASISLDSIEYIFAFGDSYTSNKFQPNQNNILKAQVQTGDGTTADGKNWIQWIANASEKITLFDFAQEGATTSNLIVNDPHALDFSQQILLYETYLTPPKIQSQLNWNSNNSIYAVWFGINDVAISYYSHFNYLALQSSLLVAFDQQIQTLYRSGARNFLLLNIPPVDRSPFVIDGVVGGGEGGGNDAAYLIGIATTSWNKAFEVYVNDLHLQYEGVDVVFVDTNAIFTTMLNNAPTFGFLDTTNVCLGYAAILTNPLVFFESCIFPLSQFFWNYQALHPTWTVHSYLAEDIISFLRINNDDPPQTTKTTASPPLSTNGTSLSNSTLTNFTNPKNNNSTVISLSTISFSTPGSIMNATEVSNRTSSPSAVPKIPVGLNSTGTIGNTSRGGVKSSGSRLQIWLALRAIALLF